MRWFILDVRMAPGRPPVWRHLQAPDSLKLPRLHLVLRELFGWKGEDAHSFCYGDLSWSDRDDDLYEGVFEDESSVTLQDLFRDGRRSNRPLKYRRTAAGQTDSVYLRVLRSGVGRRPLQVLAGEGGLDLPALQKRFERRFGPRLRPPAPTPRPLAPLDFVPVGRRLEEYDLGKLTLKACMLAALLERGQPLELEVLAARLIQAGIPVAQGVTTLRKAWRNDPMLRQRLDGRLEVNLHHPYLWIAQETLDQAGGRPEPVDEMTGALARTPLSQAELEESWHELSLNAPRRLMLLLDALGGRAQAAHLEELAQHLSGAVTGRLRAILSHGQLPREASLEGAWSVAEGVFLLNREHAELPPLRDLARGALASPQTAREVRIGQQLEHYRRSSQVLLSQDSPDVFRLRDLTSGEERWLGSDEREAWESFEVVYAVGAPDLYERLQIPFRASRRLMDLMPYAYDHGARTYPPGCSLETLVQYTLGCCWSPGADGPARMPYLMCFWAFGNLHGEVHGPYGPIPVWWNLALRPDLLRILSGCIQARSELRLAYRPLDPLQAPLSLRSFRPLELRGRSEIRGRFVGASKDSLLELASVHACEYDEEQVRPGSFGLEASFMRLDAD